MTLEKMSRINGCIVVYLVISLVPYTAVAVYIEGKALLEHIITFWSNNLMTCYGEEAQTTCFSH